MYSDLERERCVAACDNMAQCLRMMTYRAHLVFCVSPNLHITNVRKSIVQISYYVVEDISWHKLLNRRPHCSGIIIIIIIMIITGPRN